MANFVFNIALGRVAEFYNRVDTNDGANSAIVIIVLAETGLETDAVLRDKDTVSDLVSGTTNEVTNAGYARKVLTDADLAAMTPDDGTNTMPLDTADQAFGAITAGDNWRKVIFAFDPDTTGGTDTTLVPLTAHDVTINPDGSAITINVANFFSAVSAA